MHDTKIEMKLEEEMKPLKKICETLEEAVKHEFEKGIECVNVEEMGEVIDMLKDIYEAKEKLVKGCYYKQIMTAMEKSEEEDKEQEKYMLEKFKEEMGEDEGKRFYDNWRYKNGRFAPKGRGTRRGYEEIPYMMMPEMYNPEMMRDMDRMDGRMYYSGGGNSSVGSTGGNAGGQSGGMSGGNMGGSNGGGSSRGYSEGYDDGSRRGYESGYSDGQRDGRKNGGSNSRYDRAKRGYEEAKEQHKGNTPEDKQMTMREAEKFVNVILDELEDALEDASPEVKNMVKSKTVSKMQKM